MVKKNFWDLTDKPQTKIKLSILKDYFNAWAIIFAKQKIWCKKVCYIDCCAGRGKYDDQGQKDIIDGSPFIALNIAKKIKIKGLDMVCFFIERKPHVFRELEGFINSSKPSTEFYAIEGDINEKIDEILDKIPDKFPIFFFIDPEGISIKKETIKKMLNKPNIKEFLITYIQKGVERCLGFGEKFQTNLSIDIKKRAIGNIKRVEDFFGLDWKNLNKNQKENLKKYLDVFVEYNSGVVDNFKLKARTIDILYNQGRNKYYLIFISRKEGALKIIEDIFTKTKLSGTLFNSLSYKEKKRMFQGKFDI